MNGKGNGCDIERKQEACDVAAGAEELVLDESCCVEAQSWSGPGHGPFFRRI